jgi:hypothetical protein
VGKRVRETDAEGRTDGQAIASGSGLMISPVVPSFAFLINFLFVLKMTIIHRKDVEKLCGDRPSLGRFSQIWLQINPVTNLLLILLIFFATPKKPYIKNISTHLLFNQKSEKPNIEIFLGPFSFPPPSPPPPLTSGD